jgi:polynucleotide 5'-hydroxyl-kinase GRC3/NOL9
VPLVINTQGWVKGLGEELLRSIENMARPSQIFNFESDDFPISSHQQQQPDIPGWTTSPSHYNSSLPFDDAYSSSFAQPLSHRSRGPARPPVIHTLSPAPISPLQARYTASDLRTLYTIAYFHSDLNGSWDFTTSIPRMRPWETSISPSPSGVQTGGLDDVSGIENVFIIGEGSEGILLEDLHLALNGSIVALLSRDESSSTGAAPGYSQHDSQNSIYTPGRALPPLDETNFLGFGLVRAIRKMDNMNGSLIGRRSAETDTSVYPVDSHDDDPTAAVGAESGESAKFQIHLISPLPAESLSKVRYVVKNGAMELPLCGMMDWTETSPSAPDGIQHSSRGNSGVGGEGMLGVGWDEIPFLDTSGVVGVGGERRKFRRNLMRKGM